MIIRVKQNRRVIPIKIDISNQFENDTRFLEFDISDIEFKGNVYLICKHETESDFYTPLLLENNAITIKTFMSQKSGRYDCHIIVTTTEIDEDYDFSQDNPMFISDEFYLYVMPNYLTGSSKAWDVTPTMSMKFEELLALINKVRDDLENGAFNGKDGKDGKDGAQGEKGEPGRDGDNGKSAYQLALDNGFEGSEQEWLESLRYDHSDEFQAFIEQINDNVSLSQEYAESSKNEADRAEQATSDKLDKNQGVENKGKVLSVDEQGNVVPTEFKNGSDNVLTNTVEKQENPHIEDSYETEMRDLKFYGKSTQVQTTGINLFNQIDLLDIDSPNYDKSQSGSGIWWYKIEVKGAVVVSINNKSNNGYLCVSTEPDLSKKLGWLVHGSSANPNGNIVVNNPINNTIYLGVNTTLEKIESMINSTKGIMITDGTTVKPYEPYTGGKPSPSPDYPQKITGIEEVDCTVTGKNLFDVEYLRKTQNSWEIENYYYLPIKVKRGLKVSFSVKNNLGLGLPFYVMIGKIKGKTDNPYMWLYHSTVQNLIKQNGSFVAEDDIIYLNFSVGKNQQDRNTLFENMFDSLQIEISNNPTSYEPYKSQHIQFTPPQPLYRNDVVNVENGNYEYETIKYIVTGQEEFKSDYARQSGYYGRYFTLENGVQNAFNMCNYFPNIGVVWEKPSEGFTQNANSQIHLKFSNERLGITDSTPLEEKRLAYANYIKQLYESGNPLYVIIGVKQKEIPIPQETLEQLRKLKTYTGVTNIICNTPVSFEYEQSIKIVIDNIINQLQKQSIALSNVEREVVKNV